MRRRGFYMRAYYMLIRWSVAPDLVTKSEGGLGGLKLPIRTVPSE